MRRRFGNLRCRAWTLLPQTNLRHIKVHGLSLYSLTDLVAVRRHIGSVLVPQLSASTIAHSYNSQLCTHLASSGKVVMAMEHRDGTGPICRPRSEATGERSSRLYISPSEVV